MPEPEISEAAGAAMRFYDDHYECAASFLLTGNENHQLGDRQKRSYRFCGREKPAASFKKVAHAFPKALGNKGVVTYYKCDDCSDLFGRTFENDLGKWSIAARAMYQIRGKNGVPTLKRESKGWRVELDKSDFLFRHRIDNPIVEFDESAKHLTMKVRKDPYVPIAVFTAYVNMALAILPERSIGEFSLTIDWLKENVHTALFSADVARLYRTFVPGPRPLLRSERASADVEDHRRPVAPRWTERRGWRESGPRPDAHRPRNDRGRDGVEGMGHG